MARPVSMGLFWLQSTGSRMARTSAEYSITGSRMAREKWPDPKQDVLALIYREQNGQTLSWVDLALLTGSRKARPSAGCFGSHLQGAEWSGPQLSWSGSVYWEQKGQTLSRIVLAPIYREQNGQTLSWVDLALFPGSRMARTSAGLFGSNLQEAEWPDPQIVDLALLTGSRMARP